MLTYTMVHHAKQALWKHNSSEKTLKQYSIAILQELCIRRNIQVDHGGSRPLKKLYINALLTYVR